MGVLELFFTLMATMPAVVVLFFAWRQGLFASSGDRPPFPVGAGWVCAAVMVFGALVGFGFGAVLPLEWVSLPEGGQLVVSSAADVFFGPLCMGLVGATWLALPGGAALGWLVLSKRRSLRAAAGFGGLVALGFGAGSALGLTLAPIALRALSAPLEGLEATMMLDDAIGVVSRLSFALGVAGATILGVAAAGSRSRVALRRTFVLGAAVAPVALLFAALATPPDIVTQLILAGVLFVAWCAGVALAAGVRAIGAGPPDDPPDGATVPRPF